MLNEVVKSRLYLDYKIWHVQSLDCPSLDYIIIVVISGPGKEDIAVERMAISVGWPFPLNPTLEYMQHSSIPEDKRTRDVNNI